MRRREVVDDLVEAARDEVRVLHLDDRREAGDGHPQRRADRARLDDRRVADAVAPEALDKAGGELEDAAVLGDVLPHQDRAVVRVHCVSQAVRQCVDKALLGARRPGRSCRQADGRGGEEVSGLSLGRARDLGLRQRPLGDRLDLGDEFGVDRVQFGLGDAALEKAGAEACKRVARRPLGKERLGNVLGTGRLFVAAHPEGLGLDKGRAHALAPAPRSVCNRCHNGF